MKIFGIFTLWAVLCLPSFAGAQDNSQLGELQTVEGTVCAQFRHNIAQNQRACHDAAKLYLSNHKNIPTDSTDFKTYKLDFMENICSQAKFTSESFRFWRFSAKSICLDQATVVEYGLKAATDHSIDCTVDGYSILHMSEEYEKCMTDNLEKTRPGYTPPTDIFQEHSAPPNSKTVRGS